MTKKKLGKYTLIRQIAQGGMAEIWLAEQRGPGGFNKELVIKRILPHLAEEGDMTKMFFDEARIVAYLTHPNIGQVFELGEQDGDYYIAMEYIDGLDLRELRVESERRGSPLPVAYAARMVCDVLKALDYAHNFIDRDGNHVGLVHRDISPHNVLISNDGVVKLVDFGVAKAAINTHKTETGAVKGKFAYMAPEQIEANDLDHRVDIFAVGALFYELLCGEKPFGSDLKAVSLILSGVVPDIQEKRGDVPDEIAEIIDIALATDRDERFSTAAEMERALESFLHSVDEVVGTRELSVMVHQLRGLEVKKPTEQLYGFQKHGVERKKPRITKTQRGAASGGAANGRVTAALEETGEQQVIDESPSKASESFAAVKIDPLAQTQASTPSTQLQQAQDPAQGYQPGEMEDVAAEAPGPRGASVGVVLLFLLVMGALIGVISFGAYAIVAGGQPVVAEELSETSPMLPVWRHTDEEALVVFIDADSPSSLYSGGQKVGETPYQTYLRPGSYGLEVEDESGRKQEIRVRVQEGRPIQSFFFEL